MKDQEAAELFHGKERLNCAQAVLKAFQKEASLPEQAIRDTEFSGGGRALGGMCGALYGATMLVQDQNTKDLIIDQFTKTAGSTKCREIRSLRQLSCCGCVALAASLVEQQQVFEKVKVAA